MCARRQDVRRSRRSPACHHGRVRGWGPPVMLAIAFVIAACGGEAGGELHDCRRLADRWMVLRQQVLDSVDDPSSGAASADRHGLAMIEQARDARAVGCADELVVTAPLICARLHLLQPRGERGAAIVADLEAACS